MINVKIVFIGFYLVLVSAARPVVHIRDSQELQGDNRKTKKWKTIIIKIQSFLYRRCSRPSTHVYSTQSTMYILNSGAILSLSLVEEILVAHSRALVLVLVIYTSIVGISKIYSPV